MMNQVPQNKRSIFHAPAQSDCGREQCFPSPFTFLMGPLQRGWAAWPLAGGSWEAVMLLPASLAIPSVVTRLCVDSGGVLRRAWGPPGGPPATLDWDVSKQDIYQPEPLRCGLFVQQSGWLIQSSGPFGVGPNQSKAESRRPSVRAEQARLESMKKGFLSGWPVSWHYTNLVNIRLFSKDPFRSCHFLPFALLCFSHPGSKAGHGVGEKKSWSVGRGRCCPDLLCPSAPLIVPLVKKQPLAYAEIGHWDRPLLQGWEPHGRKRGACAHSSGAPGGHWDRTVWARVPFCEPKACEQAKPDSPHWEKLTLFKSTMYIQ